MATPLLDVQPLEIPEVRLVIPARHGDDRGWFVETYNRARLADAGIEGDFVQDNSSFSAQPGTLRGLHFQAPPYAQAKLVRCVRGSIWDVAVDIRAGSPSYGRWVAATLSASSPAQMYVPAGFAHGFCTLEANCEVAYKVDGAYNRDAEGGILWNDPTLAIPWPINQDTAILSEKDRHLPRFKDLQSPFQGAA